MRYDVLMGVLVHMINPVESYIFFSTVHRVLVVETKRGLTREFPRVFTHRCGRANEHSE